MKLQNNLFCIVGMMLILSVSVDGRINRNLGDKYQYKYNCEDRNPCKNVKDEKTYFPHDMKNKYVQCSESKHCFVMDCAAGTVWDDKLESCINTKHIDDYQEPTCHDGIKNGEETGVDCGGPKCPRCTFDCDKTNPCIPGGKKKFFIHADKNKFVQCKKSGKKCVVRTCSRGIVFKKNDKIRCKDSLPTCYDGVQNQHETDVDCGGPNCGACPARYNCNDRNPCKEATNIKAERFYFAHEYDTKYVQCNTSKKCFVKSCDKGTIWSSEKLTCVKKHY